MPETTKNFEWFINKQTLYEIDQSVDTKFSMAGEKDNIIKQAHPWVKCRDFLHDAIRSQITGKISNIYGFIYDPKDSNFPEISIDKTLLFISQQNIKDVESYQDHLLYAMPFIHYYENLAGVTNSTLKKVPLRYSKDKKTYKHVWLFDGDIFWISKPYMISMLTLLLRLGCKFPKKTTVDNPEEIYKEIIGKYEKEWEEDPRLTKDNDVRYLKTCYNRLADLVKLKDGLTEVHGQETFSKMYDPETQINMFHDRSGIVSACSGKTWNDKFNKIVEGKLK